MNEDQHLKFHLPTVVFINDQMSPFQVSAIVLIYLVLKLSGNSLNILIGTEYNSAELILSAI